MTIEKDDLPTPFFAAKGLSLFLWECGGRACGLFFSPLHWYPFARKLRVLESIGSNWVSLKTVLLVVAQMANRM